jgi:NAD(P)-dependent dehydrogenase (short-subunit alcohol dehydrogenase family)
MKLLITGANRGLGLALAFEAVRRGHTVFAGVRNTQEIEEGLAELQANSPHQVTIIKLDVTDENSISSAVQQVKDQIGLLDGIINNAGVLCERDKKIEEISLNQVQITFDVNLFGPMRVVKHFLPILVKSKESSIINISSEAGSYQNAYGGDYSYALSKHSLNMFTKQIQNYLKETKVCVLSVHPGWIKTDMGGEAAPGSPEETAEGILDLLERKQEVQTQTNFINFKGEPMPF